MPTTAVAGQSGWCICASSALGRHHALGAFVALDRIGDHGIHAFLDVRSPRGFVAGFWRAHHASFMAHGAACIIGGFAGSSIVSESIAGEQESCTNEGGGNETGHSSFSVVSCYCFFDDLMTM
jgi:hypothetical protein